MNETRFLRIQTRERPTVTFTACLYPRDGRKGVRNEESDYGKDVPRLRRVCEAFEVVEHVLFRGFKVTYTARLQQCAECGLELAGIEEAAVMQEQLVAAYWKSAGLLGCGDIRSLRQEKGLSQQGLADALDVG